MRSVRVLIVDDQAPFRQAAAAVVSVSDPFVVVGAVGSGEECLTAMTDLRPDLVLMDINLPGLDGIDTTQLLTALAAPPAVVLMSTYPHAEYADRARQCGAVAYIEKFAFSPDLLAATWAAAAGTGMTARISTQPSPPGSAADSTVT
jgi:DNA-binding NarL/FixJ family response regulator